MGGSDSYVGAIGSDGDGGGRRDWDTRVGFTGLGDEAPLARKRQRRSQTPSSLGKLSVSCRDRKDQVGMGQEMESFDLHMLILQCPIRCANGDDK